MLLNNSFQDQTKTAFYYQNQAISQQQFFEQIEILSQKIIKSDIQNWIIYCQDSFLFAVAFFAAIKAKKNIILPHNIQEKTLENLEKSAQGIISDLDIKNSNIHFEKITFFQAIKAQNIDFDWSSANESKIIFFTSGSSGVQKKIEKTLLYLEEELKQLDKLFKDKITNSVFISTVSHQHIYGLLFRLLFPLRNGNIVNSSLTISEEEILSLGKRFDEIILISSPAFLKRIGEESFSQYSNIKAIFSSGGLLKKYFAQKVYESFGKFPIEVLGSTETGGIAFRTQEESEIWQKFPAVSIKINSDNCLVVNSPYVCESDFIMGDTAQLLDENHFLLKERVDRIVKIEEKRISLDELENILAQNELIDSCHAVLLEKERQIIAVLVKLNDKGQNFLQKYGNLALNNYLKNHCLKYFEPIVTPRKWRYVEEIPVNSQGKIIKNEILKLFPNFD